MDTADKDSKQTRLLPLQLTNIYKLASARKVVDTV
jgi:hypothetical protein